jgi:hypothetical protein
MIRLTYLPHKKKKGSARGKRGSAITGRKTTAKKSGSLPINTLYGTKVD